jgi:hypothetical protein
MDISPSTSPWEYALDCVRRGDDDGLRRVATACLAPLRAARPMPRAGQPYGRRILLAHPRGEVMLASWRRGAGCAPHDHAGATGRVLILDGRFTEVTFEVTPPGLRAATTRMASVGEVLRVDEALVHEMRDRGDAAGPAGLTLHVYASGAAPPASAGMRVFDRQSRATLIVASHCGAWIPDDPAHVLERHPWAPVPRATSEAPA